MYCSACGACWSVLGCIACFFWHKLTNFKRVDRRGRRRGRFTDVEKNESFMSDIGSSLFADRDASITRKRKVIMKEMESSHYHNHHSCRSHHPHSINRINRKQVGLQVKDRSLKLKKLKHSHRPRKTTIVNRRKPTSFKKRRFM